MINSWKQVHTASDARLAVDMGLLLGWEEARAVKRVLHRAEQEELMRHFAERLIERSMLRPSAEIIIESVLTWIANSETENLLAVFLTHLLAQEGWMYGARALTEIGLTAEITDTDHDESLFSLAVSLVCELGLAIRNLARSDVSRGAESKLILDHIATYLLSVSNSNSSVIRLSLIHYFGAVEHGTNNHISLNRVMGRFGFTMMDHLFQLLFKKRTEAVALQYLLDNLPHILEGDRATQMLLHETFKQYMLKKPERFTLFASALVDRLNESPESYQQSRQAFMQHIASLIQVTSEVNHRLLGYELMRCLLQFPQTKVRDEVARAILDASSVRKSFHELLFELMTNPEGTRTQEKIAQIVPVKRGRKPSFAKSQQMASLHQAAFLGHHEIANAS
jgi:hypothetical protein